MYRYWISLAAVFGLTGVGMAAYTSHGLGFITDPVARDAARATFQQAWQLQLLHALALLGVGIWSQLAAPNRWRCAAGALLALGVVLFSGLIYLRTFTGIEALRPLVPWGGTSWMLGWLALGVSAWRQR